MLDLPIAAHREEILAAVRKNNVVIVCGDTGSGKTTQLPKMMLEFGRAADGRRIAITQPRRMAAVAMAERVAEELKSPVGGLVGYQHRFQKKFSDETRIKFMTDGVLLAETRHDPQLRAYDTIIVDEAHERSLNIDFLLGILKRLLARRRDLKVIVSSATLDTEGFSRFFGNAPVVEVPGRLYPVDIAYRPAPDDEEADLAGEVADAVTELPSQGDILVFLSGERDIRECAERLKGRFGDANDIIPLYASLPSGEQRRAFQMSPRRRIILSTNVAETSVTLPGIRYVIDSGEARISRYIHRTQVQRLQVERVSQASARQRAGRCGRVGPGTCIRLYSEEDFSSREAFTPPEILRSSLAGVILTMLDLGLGDVAEFPFIDPPRGVSIREGMNELAELGAVTGGEDGAPTLTAIGRKLARIPVEPRLSRIMLAASDLATLPSALPVAAALACDDPRRRPADERDKAKAAHAKWRVPGSDFLSTLKLWRWWLEETGDLSQNQVRKLCKANYLSYPKMREWRDLVRQLGELSSRLGLDVKSDNGGEDSLHRALLAGFLSRIGKFDPEERDYRGAHGVRFTLHPGSVLSKKPPEWIVAGELVDTSRLFAREAAAIDVGWIESAAGPLCRRSYREPTWDPATGFVRAIEQVTVYGLVVVPSRRCDFSRIDPKAARDIFIRFGLIEGEFPHPPREVRENASVIGEMRRRAEKLRRPELFDRPGLESFFGKAVPEGVCSANALRKWLSKASAAERAAFRLKRDDWISRESGGNADYPDTIRIGGARMKLSYRHSPDDAEGDGITCTVRRSDIAALSLWRSDWLVPGALPAKLTWMLMSLPSSLRRVLTPIGEKVSVLLSVLKPGSEPLEDAVRRAVCSEWGFRIPHDAWLGVVPPPHLRVRYAVVDDESGKTVVASRDLDEVLGKAGGADGGTKAMAEPMLHTTWDFPAIDEMSAEGRAGWKVESFAALHDEGGGVTVRLYADRAAADAEHASGLVRLFCIALKGKVKCPFRAKALPFPAAIFLKEMDYPEERIASDILEGAVREALVRGQPPVRDAQSFKARLEDGTGSVARTAAELAQIFNDTLVAAVAVQERLEGGGLPAETVDSVSTQLAWLVYRGFPRLVPLAWMRHYARYMKGIALRLDRARTNPSGDRSKESRFAPWWERYRDSLKSPDRPRMNQAALAEFRWMLEEFRISLFAPELKTAIPVSPQRLEAKWNEVI
jgi:ATP-dependent helicase HrpA